MSKVIAIDYDETITDNTPYPKMGKIRPEAKLYIRKLYEEGYTLILWTCRAGLFLKDAIDALTDADIIKYFKYINEDGFNGNNRKIIADFYFDDRSCLGTVDWKQTYEYIIRTFK